MSLDYLVCAGPCGRAIRPGQPYTYREITALEQVTRTGAGGGVLKLKTYTGRVFCTECATPFPKEERLF
jgi:hypothetical protein